jgi:tRNA(Ile)-lysidine synthase
MVPSTQWPEMARRLAAAIPLARLRRDCLARLEELDGPVAIACSGGSDSVALALLMVGHFPARAGGWLLLHFNHHLRGEESDADEAFVAAMAEGLGVPFRSERWQRMPAAAAPSEAAAREARLAFLDEACARAGAEALLLGHQADDVAETFFMRLARGSGLDGLSAPRPVVERPGHPTRLRPLLNLPRAELEAALRAVEAPWREDSTNASRDYFRNRIRLEALPAWREASPQDAFAGAGATRELLAEAEAALQSWLDELMPAPAPGEPLELAPLAGRPVALWRRGLRRWLAMEGLGTELSRACFEELLAAAVARRSAKVSVGAGCWVEFNGTQARLEREQQLPPAWGPLALPVDGSVMIPDGSQLVSRPVSLDHDLIARIFRGEFDPCRTVFLALEPARAELSVASWKPGDAYRPLGAPGTAKLQDLFTTRKVPAALRRQLPVVRHRGEVIWVPRFAPAEGLRLKSGAKLAVQLTYMAKDPTF